MYVDGPEMSAKKGASRLNDVALYCPSFLSPSSYLPASRTVPLVECPGGTPWALCSLGPSQDCAQGASAGLPQTYEYK